VVLQCGPGDSGAVATTVYGLSDDFGLFELVLSAHRSGLSLAWMCSYRNIFMGSRHMMIYWEQ